MFFSPWLGLICVWETVPMTMPWTDQLNHWNRSVSGGLAQACHARMAWLTDSQRVAERKLRSKRNITVSIMQKAWGSHIPNYVSHLVRLECHLKRLYSPMLYGCYDHMACITTAATTTYTTLNVQYDIWSSMISPIESDGAVPIKMDNFFHSHWNMNKSNPRCQSHNEMQLQRLHLSLHISHSPKNWIDYRV